MYSFIQQVPIENFTLCQALSQTWRIKVCVCAHRVEKVDMQAHNSFNVLSTVLYARDTAVQKASRFLPREVPALVREDRHRISHDKLDRCSAFCERIVRSTTGTCSRGACPANYQRNANQNNNEMSTHTCQNDYHQKHLQITVTPNQGASRE